jgi:sulfite reductase (ferredoxin)
MIGGGLGSQPRHADVLFNYLNEDRIIPLMESVLRVFDRYGERKSRAKARMKFLIKDIGITEFRKLLQKELRAIPHHSFPVRREVHPNGKTETRKAPVIAALNDSDYENWKKSNVLPQKQPGLAAVGIKVFLGDFYTSQARQLADLVEQYGSGELRLTLRQNILIPSVPIAFLPYFYFILKGIGLADLGYNKALDITACPGTDTCNLGIASSTGIAAELEKLIRKEYPQFINRPDLVIKVSGCMNACGQHTMAHIGFQGMSINTADKKVAPALQVLLGGANLGDGQGVFADKVCKIPSKRGPQAMRLILDDYEKQGKGLNYHAYYIQQGTQYFYDLLKPLMATDNLSSSDFIDWGNSEKYEKAIGIGECAGVVIDLVATLLLESDEKLENARLCLEDGKWAASIYHSYSAMVNAAKALLTSENTSTNTHISIIKDFDTYFVSSGRITLDSTFEEMVLNINRNAPESPFAHAYLEEAKELIKKSRSFRSKELSHV